MSEAQAIKGIRVENDPLEPDWRFRLLDEDALVGEVFFDADSGWDVADRPRGWTVRYLEEGVPLEFCREEVVRPTGQPLSWAKGEVAAAAGARMVAAARSA